MGSAVRKAIVSIASPLAVAALLMGLLHFWRLPSWLVGFLPILRGGVAFFVGGMAFNTVREFRRPEPPARLAMLRLRGILFVGLAGVFLVPTYCDFLHFRSALDRSADPVVREAASQMRFPDYLHKVGTNLPTVDPEEMPEGEGFFHLLVMIATFIDVLLQRLFTTVFHLDIAGYVSLFVWYLMFLLFAQLGDELVWDR